MLNSDNIKSYIKIGNINDLNTLSDHHYAQIPEGINISNAPTTGITVYCMRIGWGLFQIAIKYNVPRVYIRISFANSWSIWYILNMSSV